MLRNKRKADEGMFSPMAKVVLCSTGMSRSERDALEASAALLPAVSYRGDLTSATTHLLARRGASESAKSACAAERGLPIVAPEWLHDSAREGVLLPLLARYLLPRPAAASPADRLAAGPWCSAGKPLFRSREDSAARVLVPLCAPPVCVVVPFCVE
ncbi:hypothetical protein EMIHUDRAFT_221032 [Emiliania huxleyi CCMP1516]|uniref:BRCT domain-containing protein n=2 Tax=Emiliania huxleyi TaxID=2903 RepID=A0A0D3HZV6_EMIH1|nr:hypothetical protein EMIHUDRAFT_221032 [Emiliania huxleyi CCMP1516]EOD04541.1 hypothetical protein EMIHUDRAFT_221032 [Emiliania huxleyi CCMP1516]|eukprot:XP_005756970.1 hypothetical protein EMIHUDRAFT_221032 [Emiliania huxleyi CCMP1516]